MSNKSTTNKGKEVLSMSKNLTGNVGNEFLECFGLSDVPEIVQVGCLELVVLCLNELSKDEKIRERVRKDLSIPEEEYLVMAHHLSENVSMFSSKLFDVAGYWCNDVNDIIYEELTSLKEKGIYKGGTESYKDLLENRNIFTTIYSWLEGYDLKFNS